MFDVNQKAVDAQAIDGIQGLASRPFDENPWLEVMRSQDEFFDKGETLTEDF